MFFILLQTEPEFSSVNAQQFKALLSNVDLNDETEANVANEVISAMLLTQPPTLPPIPTR